MASSLVYRYHCTADPLVPLTRSPSVATSDGPPILMAGERTGGRQDAKLGKHATRAADTDKLAIVFTAVSVISPACRLPGLVLSSYRKACKLPPLGQDR
jgi:hypothetical protein